MLKKLAIPLILLIVLVGCNNNNESGDTERTVTICEINSMANTTTQIDGNRTVTLEAVGDHVISMDEINRMDVERFSELLDMDKEDFIRLWEENAEFVREVFMDTTEIAINGITTEILDITDEYFIMRVVSNFNEMSLEELEHFTGQPISFVSLSETIEGMETIEDGTCIQQ